MAFLAAVAPALLMLTATLATVTAMWLIRLVLYATRAARALAERRSRGTHRR